MDESETTRLRALLERAALPACEAGRDRGDNLCVYQTGRHQWTVAEVSESPDASDDAIEARAQLFAAIPTALPGLLDAAERAEREHREAGESTRAAWRESERREQELRDRLIAAERERDSLRAQLDTVAEAYRALLAGQPVPEYTGPVLSERGRAVLDRLRPRRDVPASADEAERVRAMDLVTDAWRLMSERALRAERERADLAATLETRTAEHALAMARVREMEAIIAGRSKPPTNAELVAMESAGLRLARRWHAVDKAGNVRAWPTAEVSR